MKRSVSVGVLLSAVVCLAYGCGGDDDTTSSSPHAGSAGKGGGTGGKGGAGGSSAKGGTAGGGRGGTAGAPRGGNSGRGGSAGAPRGGSSGRGGSAGDGGVAGECTEEPLGPLAECSGNEESTVATTCSFEDTCHALACGATWSQFDASGCRRPSCTASSQCDDDERCVSSLLAGVTDCFSSVFERCEVHDCSCSCSASEDCTAVAFCQPAADFPETEDCPLATVSCAELPLYIETLTRWTGGIDADDPSEVDSAVLACQHEAEQKLDACPGHGGEGGGGAGGQSGAGAGGHSGGVGGQ